MTDAGKGKPIVLIHGWPLSDEMYEYQYNDLVKKNFRVIGITFRGFGKSDKLYGAYNYDAAVPIWTHREDCPYNLPIKSVDDLIKLNNKDRPKLLSNFAKIFSANETSLNEGIGNWLNGINLSASSHATAECLVALRDTDLRNDLPKITIPTLIMHGKKDKICSFDLAELMKAGISDSKLVAFENSGHSLFLEETLKFNTELIKFAEK